MVNGESTGEGQMVIRRIREHVATHNWFAVGIDFLIVVAGIVIGTQVNNWNQARIERKQGDEYRERLLADLQSNDAHNQNRRSYWQDVRRHAQAALSGPRNGPDNDAAFLVDAYQASQILTSQSRRFTYDELISTGRLEHLGGPELRNQVAGYYVSLQAYGTVLNAIPAYREFLRQEMPTAAQQAVRTQCAEIFFPGPDGSPFNRLPDKCSLNLAPAVSAEAITAVRSAPGVVEHLNRVIADLDVKLAVLTAMDEQSRQLQKQITEASSNS